MAGSKDVAIAHIFHGRVAELTFNGLRVGEIGLNALMKIQLLSNTRYN